MAHASTGGLYKQRVYNYRQQGAKINTLMTNKTGRKYQQQPSATSSGATAAVVGIEAG